MRKVLALLLCLATPASAQVGFGGIIPGPGTPASAGGGGYSGPGDLKTYDIWVGTYAYSAAKRGTAAVNVCNGGVCGDLSTDATTGLLVTSTNINGAPCDDSGHICKIKTYYNQGSGGSTYDFTQNTDASRATLLVSCGGLTSSACGSATGAAYETANNYAQSSPFTVAAVSYRNSSTSTDVIELGSGSNGVLGGGFFGANNDAYCNFGSNLNPSATDATWHGKACAVNGASSNFTIDATNTAGNAGSSALSGHVFHWVNASGARNWQGRIASIGIAPSNFSTTELAAANSASKTILGY